MKKNNRRAYLYLFCDWLGAISAWTLFYFFRKLYLEPKLLGHPVEIDIHSMDSKFYLGLTLVPIFWMFLITLAGMYKNTLRRYRIKEFTQVFILTFVGVLILFFALLLDDIIPPKNYFQSFVTLFLLQFSCFIIFRMTITSLTVKKIHSGKIFFNTLLVGGNQMAIKTIEEISKLPKSPGNKFVGFVSVNGDDNLLNKQLPYYGNYISIKQVIKDHKIEEVIVAIETSEHEKIGKILNAMEDSSVLVKIIPDNYDILSGQVKMTSILGAPLIEINKEIMPDWQKTIKRLLDIFISIFVLTVFSPLYLVLMLLVKFSSKGHILFKQERIGKHGITFTIIKFRTMKEHAEENGPQLSSQHDERITKIGKFLRRTRLDELPQFYNVLIGEMSLVGPRPERQHYIDKIIQIAPHYIHLQKVKPGITSWGQVKYGYAENVDQMVSRLKYDLLYIENMSLAIDFKILAYTTIIILKGSGK